MNWEPVTVPAGYSDDVDDDAPIEAALVRLAAPRSPEILLQKLLTLGVERGHVVLDLGSGHGQYSAQIASAAGCTVIALDPFAGHAIEARARVEAARARVQPCRAVAEALPLRAGTVDYIWCRDMLYHVDLPRALRECVAALRPGGHMIAYQSFATDLMEPREAERLYEPTMNMDPSYFEACALDAGFRIVERDEIRSEWREFAEINEYAWGGAGLGSGLSTFDKLMRAAKLIRGGDALRSELGAPAYNAALADCLWAAYQMIGKLCPTAYVLRRD